MNNIIEIAQTGKKVISPRQATANLDPAMASMVYLICGIVGIVLIILSIVGMWKLFTKAGEKGWKSLIPFYNLYVLCRLVWEVKFFWVIVLLYAISSISNSIAISNASLAGMGFVTAVASITAFVFTVILCNKISKAYGHGKGFTVGLVIFNFLFMLILGFGKSKYVGNSCKKLDK